MRKLSSASASAPAVAASHWCLASVLTLVLLSAPALGNPLASQSPAAETPAPDTSSPASPEPRATASPLRLTAIEVEPAQPTAETLCRLKVRIENTGDRPITALRFTVTVAGVTLPVYRNQLFLENVAAGETVEVKLYNFWASETGRPAPKNGKLPVEVSLEEARWLKISMDEEGVENWDLLEAVPGLPVASAVTLPLAPARP